MQFYAMYGLLSHKCSSLQHVVFHARETVKVKVKVKSLSPVRLLATPWTAAYQAPLLMRFSRQEYWRLEDIYHNKRQGQSRNHRKILVTRRP